LSKGGISAMLELSGIICPFQVLMKLFQKSPKSRSFPLPADWKHRKIACYVGKIEFFFVFFSIIYIINISPHHSFFLLTCLHHFVVKSLKAKKGMQ
jgi:hypothetical protein